MQQGSALHLQPPCHSASTLFSEPVNNLFWTFYMNGNAHTHLSNQFFGLFLYSVFTWLLQIFGLYLQL